MYDVIIIGAGAAGLTAAIYARRAGMSALVLERTACGGQIVNSADVENFPGFRRISGWELADSWKSQALALGAELKFAAVTGIETGSGGKTVRTDKGEYPARTVIIASGVERRRLDCPGADEYFGSGVSICATCDGAFFRGRPVAVVGGGNTAFEDALSLSALCSHVTLVHRRDQFRAEPYLVKELSMKENVTILTPYVPLEVYGENGLVSGLRVRNTLTDEVVSIEAPGIFTAIGMLPDSERFSNVVELDGDGYIIAGEDCRTKTEGVFAAGDVRTKRIRQLVTAASDGAVAASQAAMLINSGGISHGES